MKTLYIVRHAKSSLHQQDIADHDRPLLEKGKKRTKQVIDYLLDHQVTVDYLVTSSALRAVETARFIARCIRYPLSQIKVDEQLYRADASHIMNQFFDLSDDYNAVMIIGHNPACTSFVNHFLPSRIELIPTSGIVCLEFDTNRWDSISNVPCSCRFTIYPKTIKKKHSRMPAHKTAIA